MAGATALIAAFGTRQRLHIFLNGTLIVRCEYTGSLTASDDANGVKLHTSTATPTTILATGDLTTGQATFVFQGGNGYSLQISGEVGPVASGKAIILSDNPIAGYSFSSDFDFLLPVESESL
jgi:hypothetical protein